MTHLWEIGLYWLGFSVVLAIGVARILSRPEPVEQELRRDVLAELRAHAWEN